MVDYAIYFGILSVIWLVIWMALFFIFDARGKGRNLLGYFNRRQLVMVILTMAAIPLGYLLSYAPAYSHAEAVHLADLYVPVDWVVDHTLLREPILQWAEIWGAREAIESSSSSRMRTGTIWGTTSPTSYAMFWLAWGAVCCVAPPYLLYRCVRLWRRFSDAKIGQGAVAEA